MWARCQYSPQYRLAVIAMVLLYKLTSFLSLSHPLLTLSTQSLVPLSLLSPSLSRFLLYTHTRLFVFPLGRTTVPGESIYWQDKESGWCEITRPHSAQQTLKWSAGLEFQTKCPLIHYTCICTENLLPQHHLFSSLSLLLCLSRPLSFSLSSSLSSHIVPLRFLSFFFQTEHP